jgi:Rieske [2Fe-2S] domain
VERTLREKTVSIEEMVIGKYYSVPAVRVKDWYGFDGWVPVIGPKHSDAEVIKFPWPHWHVDWRFAPSRTYEYLSYVRNPGYLYGRPIQCPNNRGETVVVEGLTDRRMKFKRELPPYIVAPANWKNDWISELRQMFCGTRITNGLCPHRGIPASAMIREGDVLTCPGHGLRFNATTGEALSPQSAGKTG